MNGSDILNCHYVDDNEIRGAQTVAFDGEQMMESEKEVSSEVKKHMTNV